jgi:hypothetical protein
MAKLLTITKIEMKIIKMKITNFINKQMNFKVKGLICLIYKERATKINLTNSKSKNIRFI